MDCLQIRELVIICIDANTEEEAGVATVDNLVVTELERVVSSPPGSLDA